MHAAATTSHEDADDMAHHDTLTAADASSPPIKLPNFAQNSALDFQFGASDSSNVPYIFDVTRNVFANFTAIQ